MAVGNFEELPAQGCFNEKLHVYECMCVLEEHLLKLEGLLCVLSGGRAVRGLLHPEPSEGRCQPDEAGLLLLSLH